MILFQRVELSPYSEYRRLARLAIIESNCSCQYRNPETKKWAHGSHTSLQLLLLLVGHLGLFLVRLLLGVDIVTAVIRLAVVTSLLVCAFLGVAVGCTKRLGRLLALKRLAWLSEAGQGLALKGAAAKAAKAGAGA
jgi:hypothetical protein